MRHRERERDIERERDREGDAEIRTHLHTTNSSDAEQTEASLKRRRESDGTSRVIAAICARGGDFADARNVFGGVGLCECIRESVRCHAYSGTYRSTRK